MKKLLLLFAVITFLNFQPRLMAQNIGIGTNSPGAKLHLYEGASGSTSLLGPAVFESNSIAYLQVINPSVYQSGVIFGDNSSNFSGLVYNNPSLLRGLMFITKNSPRMSIDSIGNVGIGISNPGFSLNFNNATGDKIALWGNSGVNIGLGIQNSLLQIHTDASTADIAFGYGSSTSFMETMRIKGNGNVGIGTSVPGFPLNFPNTVGDKISLYGNSGNHYGIGLQGYLLQIHSAASTDDIAFGYGSSASFSETMRIRGNGNIGIGTISPASKLEINFDGASNYGTTMLLNQNVIGNSDGPKIQFKKTMTIPKSWTAGILNGVDVGTFSINEDGSTLGFGTPRLAIKPGGNVGIGNTDPGYLLDVSQRMRLRSAGGNSAGLWLNSYGNTEAAFIGMEDDNHVGFYGQNGANWKFSMNTQTGALKINGSEGTAGQMLTSNGSGASASWNNTPKYFFFQRPPGGEITVTTLFQPIDPIDGQTFTVPFNATLIVTFNVDMFTGIGDTEIQEPWIYFTLAEVLSYRSENYAYMRPQAGTFIGHQATTTKWIPVAAGTYTLDFNIRKMNSGGSLTYSNAQVIIQAIPQ